jgi:hypothetical protein
MTNDPNSPKITEVELPDGLYKIVSPVSVFTFTVKNKEIEKAGLATTFIRRPEYWISKAKRVADAA